MFASSRPAERAGLRRQPCIVDGRLALSRMGLLSVALAAREFDIWLPTMVQQIVREPRAYRQAPGALRPRVFSAALRELDEAAEVRGIAEELALWDRRPSSDELAALPLYFVGERADETSVAPSVDAGVRERCEQLRHGLSLIVERSDYDAPRGQVVADCHRDAMALSAALSPYGAFVLTRLEADGSGAPSLCNYAEAWGLRVQKVPDCGGDASQALRAALLRCDLGPLAWAGVAFAVVQLVVPGFPVLGRRDGDLDDARVAALWQEARIFWFSVT
jgi:hypothetical protein